MVWRRNTRDEEGFRISERELLDSILLVTKDRKIQSSEVQDNHPKQPKSQLGTVNEEPVVGDYFSNR